MYETPRPTREQYLLRNRLADDLLHRIDATGDPTIARYGVTGPDHPFEDDAAVLTHLAARWSRNLAGSLDPVLDLPVAERERAAADVAARLASRRPALQAVLRHYADHPVVARARADDLAMAGLATAPVHGPDLAAPRNAGAAPVDRARVLDRIREFERTHCPLLRRAGKNRPAPVG